MALARYKYLWPPLQVVIMKLYEISYYASDDRTKNALTYPREERIRAERYERDGDTVIFYAGDEKVFTVSTHHLVTIKLR